MSITVVATIVPKPEHRDEVIAAFEEVIPAVHEEEGCELYALHEAKDHLVMVEKWASPELLDSHSRGENLTAMRPKLDGKLESPLKVQVLRPRPAGGSKGAL